jgi:heme O synthase-like polyprenyltransferase
MSTKTIASNRRRRRMFSFLWVGLLAALTIFLIYREMTAVLYILATLGVTAILVVVALSDLAKDERPLNDVPRANDSAAIGSGITSSFGNK